MRQGSYEENPPTLSDFVKRDLRWCQGNWQYLHSGPAARPALRWADCSSCLAILMYVSGPAWMLFSLVGFGRGDGAGAASRPMRRTAAPRARRMPWEPWALLAATMTLVFAPKLAGVAQVLLTPSLRRDYGGGVRVALSALVEFVFSFILAPIMAVAQSIFLLGHDRRAAPSAGRRSCATRASLGWGEACARLWPQTVLGLGPGHVGLESRARSRRAFGPSCSAARCCSRCRSRW